MRRDVTKGDLPALILAVLADSACHGYGIARRIEQQSAQALQMKEGSLYPALRVLEQEGLLSPPYTLKIFVLSYPCGFSCLLPNLLR